MTIQMSKYGGFEQVGDLGKDYTADDKMIIAEAGDIMLYLGNKIVVYYDSNTWEYTRLGKIKNLDKAELTRLLDGKDVKLKLSLKP